MKKIKPSSKVELKRLTQEFQELETRLKKLETFIQTETFKQLPTVKRMLLNQQAKKMAEYHQTLAMRLELELNTRILNDDEKNR